MNALPEIKGATLVNIPEHEVLLSFESDAEADEWVSWWYNEGYAHFAYAQPEVEEGW